MIKRFFSLIIFLILLSDLFSYDLRKDFGRHYGEDDLFQAVYSIDDYRNDWKRKELFRFFNDQTLQPESLDSDVTVTDLVPMSPQERRILRNAYYARRGYRFRSPELTEYFSAFEWYSPVTSDPGEIEKGFSDREKANIELIRKVEADPEIYDPEVLYAAVNNRDLYTLEHYTARGGTFDFVFRNTTPLLNFLDPDQFHTVAGDSRMTGDGVIDPVEGEVIRFLLEHGAQADYNPNHAGWSPWFLIFLNQLVRGDGDYTLLEWILRRQPSLMEETEVFNSEIYTTGMGNVFHSPLTVAAGFGDTGVIELFFSLKTDLDPQSIWNEGRLNEALLKADFYDESGAMELLLKAGADPGKSLFKERLKYFSPGRDLPFLELLAAYADHGVLQSALALGAFYGAREFLESLRIYPLNPDAPEWVETGWTTGKEADPNAGYSEISALEADLQYQKGANRDLLLQFRSSSGE